MVNKILRNIVLSLLLIISYSVFGREIACPSAHEMPIQLITHLFSRTDVIWQQPAEYKAFFLNKIERRARDPVSWKPDEFIAEEKPLEVKIYVWESYFSCKYQTNYDRIVWIDSVSVRFDYEKLNANPAWKRIGSSLKCITNGDHPQGCEVSLRD